MPVVAIGSSSRHRRRRRKSKFSDKNAQKIPWDPLAAHGAAFLENVQQKLARARVERLIKLLKKPFYRGGANSAPATTMRPRSSNLFQMISPNTEKFFDDDDGDLLDLANALRQYSRWRTRMFVPVTETMDTRITFSPMTIDLNDIVPNKTSTRTHQFEEKIQSETLSELGMATPGVPSDYSSDVTQSKKKNNQ